jgi:flagellar biosynthesis chaperone FliJ
MIERSLKGKALVLAVFIIGIATGMLILNVYETRVSGTRPDGGDRATRAERAQRDVSRIHDYLGLTEDQKQQVNEILENTRTEFRELQRQTRPQFTALQEASRGRIRAILSEEQQKKYDEFLAEQSNRRRRN